MHVHTVAFGEDFLEFVADFLLQRAGASQNDFSRVGVVFSGKRPALFLKKKLASKIKGPFMPPKLFSWEEFIEYILKKDHPYSFLHQLDASFFIYQLARSLDSSLIQGRSSFAQFFPWSRQILTFMEQLDLEDIASDKLTALNKIAEIGFDVPEEINSLLKNIFLLREKFHEHLIARKSYTRGLIYLLASRFASRIRWDEFDCLIICGLFYLHRSEMNILKAVASQKETYLFLQNNNYAWQSFAKWEESFHIKIASHSPVLHPHISIYAAADIHAQALVLRQILSEIKRPEKTAVVVLEPENLVVFLSHIASLLKEFNVSLGFPIKRSPLYTLIRNIFDAQLSRRQSLYYIKDYLNVLRHPYCKNIRLNNRETSVTRILVHKIEEFLWPREGVSSLFISLAAVEKEERIEEETTATLKSLGIEIKKSELQECLRQLHSLLFLNWEEVNSFSDLAANLKVLLELLIEKGLIGLYGLHLKVADNLLALLDELQRSEFSQEEFSFSELTKVFNDSLEGRMVTFSGSPLRGLQVLGFFETRDLSFEDVIFMGINEGVLPKLNIHQPLIPREVMLALGLERVKSEEEIQRYHFRRLLAGAKRACLVFSENKEKAKSRFLEEIIWEQEKKEKRLGVLSPFHIKTNIEIMGGKERIVKTSSILQYLRESFVYSATALDTYLHCPLRFYYAYVLRLREKEDISGDLEHSQIGNFIHSFLQKVFWPYRGRRWKMDARFKKSFFRMLDEEFEKTFGQKGHSDAFLLKDVISFRLGKFIEQEAKRLQGEILFLEEEFRFSFPSPHFDFQCVAKLDRAEKFSSHPEKILIIDYKTGSTGILPLKKIDVQELGNRKAIRNKIKSFQMPLYIMVLKKEFPAADINAALYSLKEAQLDYFFPPQTPSLTKEESMNTLFIPAIRLILEEIVNPDKYFEPDKDDITYCSHCPFVYMCP